jgi:hypothetical protein
MFSWLNYRIGFFLAVRQVKRASIFIFTVKYCVGPTLPWAPWLLKNPDLYLC